MKYRVRKADGSAVERCVRFKEVTKVTKEEPVDSDVFFDHFNTLSQLFNRYASDLTRTYKGMFLLFSLLG